MNPLEIFCVVAMQSPPTLPSRETVPPPNGSTVHINPDFFMKSPRNYHLLLTGQFLGAFGDNFLLAGVVVLLTLRMKLTTKNPAPAEA